MKVDRAVDGYEITFVGNFTKDTIVRNGKATVVPGGGFNYGCHAARALGRITAAVTRLAPVDRGVVEELEALGVAVHVSYCPQSTCLTLEYPADDPDERRLSATSVADPIGIAQFSGVRSRSFVVSASFHGEVEQGALELMAQSAELLALDVQGFVRVVEAGRIEYQPWPEEGTILPLVSILKTDAVEAQVLTGESDHRRACRLLRDLGAREILLTHRKGILVFDGRQFFEAPFVARGLAGRSGRGDTCLAAYVSQRLYCEPREAIRWAAALTSLKLETPGPFRGSRVQVEKMVEERYATSPPH